MTSAEAEAILQMNRELEALLKARDEFRARAVLEKAAPST